MSIIIIYESDDFLVKKLFCISIVCQLELESVPVPVLDLCQTCHICSVCRNCQICSICKTSEDLYKFISNTDSNSIQSENLEEIQKRLGSSYKGTYKLCEINHNLKLIQFVILQFFILN